MTSTVSSPFSTARSDACIAPGADTTMGEETVEVIGCVGGGLSASVLIREQQPDVVLIDSNLPEDEMLALVRKIKDETPEIRCVVLTDTRHRERQVQIAGADVVLSQGRVVDEIIKALKDGSVTS